METLTGIADAADAMARQARRSLVSAVRSAANDGVPQAEIAHAIGRSQPEVSRLLHFHGTSPLARRLRKARPAVLSTAKAAGGRDVRVFGSVANETDGEGSDVDLLFDMREPLSLMELERLRLQLEELLDVDVDLVPIQSLRPGIRERVLAEAVLL